MVLLRLWQFQYILCWTSHCIAARLYYVPELWTITLCVCYMLCELITDMASSIRDSKLGPVLQELPDSVPKRRQSTSVSLMHIRLDTYIYHVTNWRLTSRSHDVSRLPDIGLKASDRSEIWQAHLGHCCWDECQIPKQQHKLADSRLHEISYRHWSVKPTVSTWWRHQMETFFVLLVLFEGNPPVNGGLPSQRPVTRQSFDVFCDLRSNKRLRRRWFETSSLSLWRHRFFEIWRIFTKVCDNDIALCLSHIILPGPARAVPGLFWTKIVSPLTGPARAPCGAVRILPPRTGPIEFKCMHYKFTAHVRV